MDGKQVMEWVWRGTTAFLIPAVLALGGWVWNMQTTVTNLTNDLGDAEEHIEHFQEATVKAQGVNNDVIAMKKDIEYMRKTMDRIERSIEALAE